MSLTFVFSRALAGGRGMGRVASGVLVLRSRLIVRLRLAIVVQLWLSGCQPRFCHDVGLESP
jgi:hypothetical protein